MTPRSDANWILAAPVALASAAILGLLAFVVWISFGRMENGLVVESLTLINYINLFDDPLAGYAARNTLAYAALTTLIAAGFGLPLAWLVERTDLRGKAILSALLIIGLLVPGFFTAMGWVLLLHPRIGLFNQLLMGWLGLSAAPLPINTVTGMAWVEGLTLAPLFFLMTSGSFRSMDPALEEAARMAGASPLQVMRRILAPLLFPAMLAACIFVFTTALGAFDVPGTIGLSGRILTFSTYLYVKTSAIEGLPDYGAPAAFGACMLVFSGLVSLIYMNVLKQAHRYQIITGKAYRPRLVALGPFAGLAWSFAALYVICAFVLPLLLVVWASLLPFYQPPSVRALSSISFAAFTRVPWELVLHGLRNSLILAVMAPTLALAVSIGFSWIVLRSRMRGRLALDLIAFLPHAVPGLVFALGAVLVALFVMPAWAPLYGSLTIIIIVCAIGWVAFGTRVVNSSLMQIHSELEEAALVSGAGRLTVLRKVLLPLMWPALASAWVWLALLALRELTRAIILSSAGNTTLPVITWSLWNGGQINQAAAIVMVTMVLFAPLLIVYFRLAARSRAL